jgi:hypothetical protein
MLTRTQVFALISNERAYQDVTYDPNEVLSTGVTRLQRDLDVTPGILMLEEYNAKARAAWVARKGSDLPALQQIAKIAAIATRILERAGGSEELLTTGLR